MNGQTGFHPAPLNLQVTYFNHKSQEIIADLRSFSIKGQPSDTKEQPATGFLWRKRPDNRAVENFVAKHCLLLRMRG
ncbi:MAG: hypothetical protein ACYS30_24005 [Planctomycetota bacterium]|jgi:hypothetical protein